MKIDTVAKQFRLSCRSEVHNTQTAGQAAGYAQANLVILPTEVVNDFKDFCFRNPVPCPLLAYTEGNPNKVNNIKVIDDDYGNFDIRTDLPKYNIYENGKLIKTKSNILEEWDSDRYVGFLIGCSFSFEYELAKNGLTPKHILLNTNVSIYKTTLALNPAGVFVNCKYVVSMRPYKEKDLDKVREITRAFKVTHGEPIDWGFDAVKRLGINDLNSPDYGSFVEMEPDEIPVFWACGVTPQLAIETVGEKIDGIVMTHTPGHMLILDITDEEVVNL
ncbi:hypothetical protein PACTADRAFT_72204 [Pachysolen tannophilus NRRL Y-2460]|uniref:DUF1445 domain-containing protein n=1 Tax=Pachysolen tannophilus NRRL Y-2460 TaxID=669874 RepID=A0A1E4TN14_PACTA|nr:hypothetical protein PACTADRAFT_72204 [Pachysolen tannophilus NRRL Y-2460]